MIAQQKEPLKSSPNPRHSSMGSDFMNNRERLLAKLFEGYRQYAESMTQPHLPVVFIIGAGRTGSTLISQLLHESGMFGCVSNIAARFPKAPAMGMMISQELEQIICKTGAQYNSNYGRTDGLLQPHEFGYFWDRWFDLGQKTHNLDNAELAKVDRVGLLNELTAMESIWNKPLAFKNNTWLTLQASFIASILPSVVFVVCRREPIFTAQSHLFGRELRFGDREKWWSIRPSTYPILKDLSLWEQLAGQVIDIERELDMELSKIPNSQIVEAPYEEVCRDPNALFSRIYAAVKAQGARIKDTFTFLETFKSRNTKKIPGNEWILLEQAIKKMCEWDRHSSSSGLNEG